MLLVTLVDSVALQIKFEENLYLGVYTPANHAQGTEIPSACAKVSAATFNFNRGIVWNCRYGKP